jgi:hypothetical protein
MAGILKFKASTELIIESEKLTPDEITARIGVPCDRCWKIGDLRGKTGKVWANNGWVLRASALGKPETRSSPFLAAMGNLIERLRPISKNIGDLSEEADIGVSVEILASEVPGLSIDRDVLKAIADVGAWLDIDVVISETPNEVLAHSGDGTDEYRVQ